MSEGNIGTEFSSQLWVTDRNLDTYRKFVHFVPEALPGNALVVNVGGGEKQIFEEQMKLVRPDVKIITLDPSLHSENAQHELEDEEKMRILSKDEVNARIENLPNKKGTLEAYGQQMPLKSDSLDAVLDVHAASQWSKNVDGYKKFIQESMRVLKPGGKLYIGNVFSGDPIPGDEASGFSTIREAREVFDDLRLDAEVFLSPDGVYPEYKGKQNVVDNRVCAIVTK
jgi:ubiquinone/menaquinone biosynthesis C-methylase UbiE